jgi:aspartate aminotransferase
VDSVSKRYSECGIRIGALITKNKAVRESVMKFCQARLSPPLFGQVVAEASLSTQEEYMQEVYDEYLGRRNFLIDQLNQIPGVFAPAPTGAFYVMVELPVDDVEKFCKWCLTDFSYPVDDPQGNGTQMPATIMMAPGTGFYTNPEDGRHQVRMAYILNKEDLGKAMIVLRKALEAYNAK